MAIKKPAKPKFKKMPKQPKSNASTQTWKNYEERVKGIEQENDKKVAEYKKKLKDYQNEQRKRDAIKDKVAKAKAKLSGI